MTQSLQKPIRKTALAKANYCVCTAGIALAAAGMPPDAPEFQMLKEVLRLLKARAEKN